MPGACEGSKMALGCLELVTDGYEPVCVLEMEPRSSATAAWGVKYVALSPAQGLSFEQVTRLSSKWLCASDFLLQYFRFQFVTSSLTLCELWGVHMNHFNSYVVVYNCSFNFVLSSYIIIKMCLILCVYVRASMYVCAPHICLVSLPVRVAIRAPWTGVTGPSEYLVNAGNGTKVFCNKSNYY